MRLISRLLLATTLSTTTCLAIAEQPTVPLNTISMNLSAEKWVIADTAKVSVAVNAALTSQQLATFQDQVKTNLQKLAKSDDWHIIAFEQNKDQSGLESVKVLAQARLPASALATLNSQAKSLSEQGAHYEIVSVDFTPSFKQVQQTNSDLRQALYGKVKDELAVINQTYAPQKFHVYDIKFQHTGPMPQPRYKTAGLVLTRMDSNAATTQSNSNVSVSQKVVLSATVQFASTDNLPKIEVDD